MPTDSHPDASCVGPAVQLFTSPAPVRPAAALVTSPEGHGKGAAPRSPQKGAQAPTAPADAAAPAWAASAALFGMSEDEYVRHIQALVRAAPPLSRETRDRVRLLMHRQANKAAVTARCA